MNEIRKFLDHLQAQGHSANTLQAYRQDLTQFAGFVGEDMGVVNQKTVREYLRRLYVKGLSSRTIARKLAAINSFFKYLRAEGLTDTAPTEGISVRNVREDHRLPCYLELDEVDALLGAPSQKTVMGLRDRAIMELLFATGMRVGELTTLDLCNLDLFRGLVKVMGKGKKERMIPIGRAAGEAVEDYLDRRDEWKSSCQAVFLSVRRQRISDPVTIKRRIQKYAAQVGIDKKITPHTFRHSFATHMVNGGADLRSLMEFLGHTSLRSTQIYLHVSAERLREVYDQAHPRAKESGRMGE